MSLKHVNYGEYNFLNFSCSQHQSLGFEKFLDEDKKVFPQNLILSLGGLRNHKMIDKYHHTDIHFVFFCKPLTHTYRKFLYFFY